MMTHLAVNGVYPATQNKLDIYRIQAFDEQPNLTHAIFTRNGGLSRAPFQSLNLSIATGDDPVAVKQNFQLVCQSQNITSSQTATCHLVHGATVLTVTATNHHQDMGQADGLVTSIPGIYLSMRFADCTPLLFYDKVQHVVGLAHAGWRGTLQNIAGAIVATMQNGFGSRPEHITATIGPAIGPCCYEVGTEVITGVKQVFNDTSQLLLPREGKNLHFNLWEANRQQLVNAGVGEIIQTELCTACHTETFFSHRAEKGRTGRFGVIIGLQGQSA